MTWQAFVNVGNDQVRSTLVEWFEDNLVSQWPPGWKKLIDTFTWPVNWIDEMLVIRMWLRFKRLRKYHHIQRFFWILLHCVNHFGWHVCRQVHADFNNSLVWRVHIRLQRDALDHIRQSAEFWRVEKKQSLSITTKCTCLSLKGKFGLIVNFCY